METITFYQLSIRNIARKKMDIDGNILASNTLSIIFNKDWKEILIDINSYKEPIKKVKTIDDKYKALQIWSGGDISNTDMVTDAQINKLWKQYGKQVELEEADEALQDLIRLRGLI